MRKEFVNKYNIINTEIDIDNPLTIGNGNIAFSCDVTGLQSLNSSYTRIPLLTMTNHLWVKYPIPNGTLELEEFKRRNNKNIQYMTKKTGQEELYDALRYNHHKFNLFQLAFVDGNKNIEASQISDIYQKLDLYTGEIVSSWKYKEIPIQIIGNCSESTDVLKFKIKSKALKDRLKIRLCCFVPDYGLKGMTKEKSILSIVNDEIRVSNSRIEYKLFLQTNASLSLEENSIYIYGEEEIEVVVGLDKRYCENRMDLFWKIIRNYDTKDSVLNERMVKSLYLLRVNCCGDLPPAETGLTCNSWYGKFHLEMHLIHLLGLIEMGAGEYVLPSLKYYISILDSAIERAKTQGYSGARWPKMTDSTGVDSPSNIGCLLVWQQPHILIMLEALIRNNSGISLAPFRNVIKETVDFICSFFLKEGKNYVLDKPLIPVQECHLPEDADSPIFEVEYLRHSLLVGRKLYSYFKLEFPSLANEIIEKAIQPKIMQDVYLAHQGCEDTYTTYANDHPMVVFPYTYFKSERINDIIMSNTYQKVKDTYDLESFWGWDFAFMAMCAYHLNDLQEAISMLKYPATKNVYLKNGHNQQSIREDLPLYLPGNGALILAIASIFKSEE